MSIVARAMYRIDFFCDKSVHDFIDISAMVTGEVKSTDSTLCNGLTRFHSFSSNFHLFFIIL